MITRSQLKHDAWETVCIPHVVPGTTGFRVGWKLPDDEFLAVDGECGLPLLFFTTDAARVYAKMAERLTAQAIARAL